MRPSRELVEFLFVVSMFAVAILIALFFNVRVGNAHPIKFLVCDTSNVYRKAQKLDEKPHPTLPYWVEFYDTNDDGVPDIQTWSGIIGIGGDKENPQYIHNETPSHYVLDTNFDGWADGIWVDRRGIPFEQRKDYPGMFCDIYLYKVIKGPNKPSIKNPEM